MQQAETKLVGNLRLDRHEMPSLYNYKFPLDYYLQTARREENRNKKLIIMNSDIVETFLSYRTKWGKVSFWPKIVEVAFLLTESCFDPPPRFFWRCTAFNQFNWWMRIQLRALSGFIYWGSIKIAPSTAAKVHETKSVRCVGIFRIWWAQAMIAVIGVFLAPNYRPTISLSWPRVGSASNFQPNSGSSE